VSAAPTSERRTPPSPADAEVEVVVGIDAGGTKTALMVEGRSGGSSRGEPRTHVVSSAGWDAEPAERAARWLHERIRDVLAPGEHVAALAVGAQGLDADSTAAALTEALRRLGHPRVRCVNDAALLVPAAGLDSGIGLIAGTGAIGVGTDAEGRFLATGGWGWVIGDEAGAAGIVREAARAALLAHDDGRADDGLLAALLSSFGVADAERLARAVNDEPTMANWAPHAPAVFAAADAGSALASQVVDEAAAHLTRLVAQLRRRGAVGGDVVVAGGVITRQPRLLDALRERLRLAEPDLAVQVLTRPPVAGALALARAAAQWER
jgi:N-acetylglucosamine kinase-like BadF-type ATPase